MTQSHEKAGVTPDKSEAAESVSDQDYLEAEARINLIAQAIDQALDELESESEERARQLAIKRLLRIAIDACQRIQRKTHTDLPAIQALARTMTHWPVSYSAFPGDEEGLQEHLQLIQFAINSPISRQKWRLRSVGARWAFAYWKWVSACSFHLQMHGSFPAGEGGFKLFNGADVIFREDAVEAAELPPLSKDAAVLKAWNAAFAKNFNRHLPGDNFLEHPDWKSYFAKSKLTSIGKKKSKTLEVIAAGSRVIAL